MFENLFLSLLLDRIMRSFASVQPSIFGVFIMSEVVKGGIFEATPFVLIVNDHFCFLLGYKKSLNLGNPWFV